MNTLKMLFGAHKPELAQRGTVTFREIDPNSEHSKKSIALARNDCHSNEWNDLQEKLNRLPVANRSKAEALLSELHKGLCTSLKPGSGGLLCSTTDKL